jgi:hypothetical protein
MKDLSALVPRLQRRLPEDLICWVSGEFIDRPRSMRTGIVGVTETRVVFFRRKLLSEEYLSMARRSVQGAAIGAFGGIVGPSGQTVPEVRIAFADGTTWRITMIGKGDPEELVAALTDAT